MRLVRILFIAAFLHFLAMVLFPFTGPNGFTFLFASFIGSIVVITALWGLLGPFLVVSKLMSRGAELLISGVVAMTLLFLMPQDSGKSAYRQLVNGQYPSLQTVEIGLTRCGLSLPKQLKKKLNIAREGAAMAKEKLDQADRGNSVVS